MKKGSNHFKNIEMHECPSGEKCESERQHQRAWDEKMAELEMIHREIAPQVREMRTAEEGNETESILAEFDRAFYRSRFGIGSKGALRTLRFLPGF